MSTKLASRSLAAPIAYSYVRFSSPVQAQGDSLRRQIELRDAWLAKSGARLDTSLTLRDEGVSAYTGGHRENPDRNALAAFLDLVERGRVPRGSFLIVESLDRLSREHIRPALSLILNLIESGIRIVQLLPLEMVYGEDVEPMQLMQGIMELSRGHSESKMKSERIGKAWQEKKKLAATDGVPLTKNIPAWLTIDKDGAFRIDKSKAAIVRRIFALAREGRGISAIAKLLNVEHVEPIARLSHWARAYVAKILRSRAVLGEFQPMKGRRAIPDGKPIPNYYPSIISEDEWHAARAAMIARRNKGGRPTKHVNIFAGLLRDARDGGRLHLKPGTSGLQYWNPRSAVGIKGAEHVSFPTAALEFGILSMLREIDPREILPRDDGAADQVLSLTGRLADTENRIEKIKVELMEGGDLAPLVAVLRELESKRGAIADELAEAISQAASPLSEAWGETRGLLDTLGSAPDPESARIRLRSVLRRITDSIWCLFVGQTSHIRIAAVQLHFVGGGVRHFLIVHKGAIKNGVMKHEAQTMARSFKDADIGDDLDLRRREHARALAKLLITTDAMLE